MQKCGAGKFVFGIPAREPEMGLLWIPESDIKRRCVETEGKAMPIFPSWTWAGWSGPVRWPATLSRGGAVAPVPGSPVEVRWLPKRAESSLGIPANSLSASDDMACELSVRTSTSQDFYFYDPVSIQWEGQISYKIYNSEGHHCGAIYTSEELWTVDSNQPYKFVLLSSVLLSDEHLDSWVSKRFPVFDHMEYAITKRCLRNVMLVRMLGKGYVERLAVCQIHKDAWASALTEEDTIRFI
ncbi:hypothetical protein M501DRAFT_1035561 [Patellaria atrata CBS 101060]|uniref:Uncharacterized protein n=1 Tax=Patellaria atrata CBS 101060 TaxID=1346257 RepID=A0A9P4S0V8_9PEZI|nr:hypothetical protein M501DRAFT_1035561 [Patellaria atrata CBS 101060]